MKVKVKSLCPTLCDPMDCSLPGSSIHGIFQARILEWVVISFSTQRLNPALLHCRKMLYCLTNQGSVVKLVKNLFYIWFISVQLLSCVRFFVTS